MSFATLTGIAGSASLLILMLVAAGWLWIYLKTGSSYAPSMRIWRVLTGGRETTDPQIRAYLEEQDSLMAFRLGSGMRARSAENARLAIEFVAEHKLSSDQLRQVGRYFNADKLEMAPLPSMGWRALQVLSAVVLAVVFFAAGLIATDQRVLVSLKKTDSWFWLSPTSAQALHFPLLSGNQLSFSECPEPNDQGDLAATDVDILCSIKADPAFNAYLNKALKSQRTALIVLMIVSILTSVSQWREFIRVLAADRFGKELLNKLEAKARAQVAGSPASETQV